MQLALVRSGCVCNGKLPAVPKLTRAAYAVLPAVEKIVLMLSLCGKHFPHCLYNSLAKLFYFNHPFGKLRAPVELEGACPYQTTYHTRE